MFLNTGGVSYGDQYDRIVPETEGLSGGDIKEICRRAVLHGVRQTPKTRGKEDLVLKEDDVLGAIDRWRLTKSG
jgi:SpoVK/Ycf46/Vps4 family AAA+-type ATPase